MTNEQIVADLMTEQEKLQYDEGDSQRIYDAAEKATQSFVSLLGLVAEFRNELDRPVDEESGDRMKYIRQDLVTMYADSLVNLHKLGATFRISDEAFKRMVEYLKGPENAALVMAGL